MLMYGPLSSLNIGFSPNCLIYNLTSMREGLMKLPNLIPPNELGRFTERDFDIVYMKYILENDIPFCEFFQLIYNLYIGKDIFLVADESDWSENILESLLKLIQQRYGYNAICVRSEEDYLYASSITVNFDNSYGLYNLDIDKERFARLIERYRLSTMSTNNPLGFLPYNLEGFVVVNE